MNKIEQLKELLALLNEGTPAAEPPTSDKIGEYVIVRCRDAGVHAGVLVSASFRRCSLSEARRLWYWKPIKGAFLSAVAAYGLSNESKVGAPISVDLTENCEIILCSAKAEASIRALASHGE